MALGNLASILALPLADQDLKFFVRCKDLKDHLTSEETFSALSDRAVLDRAKNNYIQVSKLFISPHRIKPLDP